MTLKSIYKSLNHSEFQIETFVEYYKLRESKLRYLNKTKNN